MTPRTDGAFRASPRLKNALVADLVFENLDQSGDHYLTDPLNDEYDWTEHFGRQLGLVRTWGDGGIHDTLIFILQQVDDLLRTWPPPQSPEDCRPLIEAATRSLTPIEVWDTLLAGPAKWRKGKIPEGTVERLPERLRPVLDRELAASLSQVLTTWVEWDIRKLRERRQEAMKAAEDKARAEARAAAPPRRRPTRKEIEDNRVVPFDPPGRT